MSEPIMVCLCGKIPSHLALVPRTLMPECEVDQIFYNIEVFVRTFPGLEKKPAAIIMGGGFDQTEFNIAYSVPGASLAVWFRPHIHKPGNEHMLGKPPPPAAVVAAGAKKALAEHMDMLKDGSGAGKIIYY